MAITVGATKSNSGNQATSSSFSFNHTTDANTKALVVVVTGMDSSDTDSAVSGITFDSVALTHPVTRYRNGSVFIDIWYKSIPAIASTKAIAVTMGGTCTDVQASAINLVDASATGGILYDSTDTGTGTGSASGIVNPARTGSYAVGGGVAQGGTTTSLSVTTGTEVTGSEVDMGSQTASVGYVAEASGSATITWTYAAVQCDALAATFYSEFTPTVVLNTPADAGSTSDTTPTLDFTGTDANGDSIEYQVQVDTVNTFDSQGSVTLLVDSNIAIDATGSSVGTRFGNVKIGESLQSGAGGVLDHVNFQIKKLGTVTGNAVATIYAHSGTYGTSSIPTGAALATSDNFDVSTLTTSFQPITFTFSGANRITLSGSTNYIVVLEYSGTTDASNDVLLGRATSGDSGYGGNASTYNSSWAVTGTLDVDFDVYVDSAGPLVEKRSDVDTTLFVNPDTGGDTHPFNSGENIQFTPTSALSVGTYYWRVAGLDPAGSNTYGAWSSTRSFTVVATTSNPRSGMWRYLPILAQ